ncbi:uncharacterized protein LOC113498685 isoform X2 [Trichoplusia ni]|uniref:Uncharacterized protein LOC113498685 isoform X2 n=1 Tax=Trichoplusia ni TaxID=7111 RepID=A0A7E5W2T4_TRINI|nr:uncharacterized protein LOC113498685 isoform X2 [Trichoplusia ni]
MAEVDKYTGLTKERFDLVMERYRIFQSTCDDVTKTPTVVFDRITQKSLDELALIREVSQDLQRKKEEDVRKAAQALEEEIKKNETAAKQEVEEEKKEE